MFPQEMPWWREIKTIVSDDIFLSDFIWKVRASIINTSWQKSQHHIIFSIYVEDIRFKIYFQMSLLRLFVRIQF